MSPRLMELPSAVEALVLLALAGMLVRGPRHGDIGYQTRAPARKSTRAADYVSRSREALSRLRASSHWPSMWSSHRLASSRRVGSISQTWSRPTRAPRTRPAPASTCRCFVTAWRVTPAPAVRRAIDIGPPVHSRATRPRRVWSPSAAKTGAAPASSAAWGRSPPSSSLARRRDILLARLHLKGPALPVHSICLGPARQRDLIEPGLYHGEHGAAGSVRELKDHEGGGLDRIVDAGLHGVRVPAPGEQPLGLHPLDGDVEHHVLVPRVGDRPAHMGARRKGALHLDAEPRAELRCVGERAPHSASRRAQQDLPLDAVRVGWAHVQPPGCRLATGGLKCNWKVALGGVTAPEAG